jgi:benzoyl-CoA 2,3-epoxidase subunit B
LSIDLQCRIPNNVGLAERPALRHLLEWFDGRYRDWWQDWGPLGMAEAQVYLRTPVDVDAQGWASYGHVKLRDYRWGVFQAPPKPDRRALFGRIAGQPVWQTLPQEYAQVVRRHLVTQGDTEPGSVEQTRRLAASAPSLYDLRNLIQFSVEEGRHLWAMVHLLFDHFGAEGRDEAEGLLSRRAGDPGQPRLLEAFNHQIEDWLSYFLWCFLADRDGKYQLLAVAESAFDPLARTVQFMLTEEAHHMFIGEDGLRRVVQRSLELMQANDTDQIGPLGGIELPLIQRYINLWAPRIYDLFGNDESARPAELFDCGLRGRAFEPGYAEHQRLEEPISVERRLGDALSTVQVPARAALNGVMRQAYLKEVEGLLGRINRMIERAGAGPGLRLPSPRFNRRFGPYAGEFFSPAGEPLGTAARSPGAADWLPREADRGHLAALMRPVMEPGRIAGWIAPPARGMNAMPALDFQYVRL